MSARDFIHRLELAWRDHKRPPAMGPSAAPPPGVVLSPCCGATVTGLRACGCCGYCSNCGLEVEGQKVVPF